MRALLLILFALLSLPAFSSTYSTNFAVTTLAPYTDNGDGSVTDPRTGLTWMRCAMGQTWAGGTCSGTASAYAWDQAVALTGSTSFAGKSDWRLPNIRELQSIVDRSTSSSPAINTAAFPNAPSSDFWSGSLYANNSGYAWRVNFNDGYVFYGNGRGNGNSVRLVRGGQSLGLLNPERPTSDYVDQGNGTTTHTPSGLVWKRCAEGQTWSGSTCTGTASTYTWYAALALSSTFAGNSDWRLPTTEELSSLADYTTFSPAINTGVFPNTPSSLFWSGSPDAYHSGYAWGVYFNYGHVNYGGRNDDGSVRLVRGGQSLVSFALTASATGSGSGTLTSSPGGLNCTSVAGTTSGTCSAALASGTSVTLAATPATGSTFTGWSGACSGSSATCALTMDAAKSVTANFNSTAPAPQTITFGPAPIMTVGATGTVSATASSGLPVTISSTTIAICTVSGNTVTGVAAGTCTLAGNQAGNGSTSAAPQVLQNMAITVAVSRHYSKIANNGSVLANSAALGSGPTDWACTRDNRSGLLWEVKTADGGLRDQSNSYTHYDDPTQAQKWDGSAYVKPTQAEIDAASNSIGFAQAVNARNLCGQSDWRMPGKEELANLLETSYAPAATIDPGFFPNTPSWYFWSGSPDADYSYYGGLVGFYDGDVGYSLRSYGFQVRLVRGGQPLGTFALSLSASGTSGQITGSTGGLNCHSTAGMTMLSDICSAPLARGTVVTLTATSSSPANSRFSGWSGACSGTNPSCTVTMDAAKSVSAVFVPFSTAYSKIANTGTVLADSAALGSGPTDWACTRDNTTGLIWEVKTTDAHPVSGLRDMSNSYTNYDNPAQPQKSDGSKPTQAEIDAATNSIGFAQAVNARNLCGQSDWRMPSQDELFGLVAWGTTPTISPSFFPNTPSSYFWSGSPSAFYSNYAWLVNFVYGLVNGYGDRSHGLSVRLVRGGQSLGTFALLLSTAGLGSGTLTSSSGGLNCSSAAGAISGTCSANLPSGTAVTLAATPAAGSTFTGWSGACSGTNASCTLTVDATKRVTANFNSTAPASQTITFGPIPTVIVGGTGTVSATASSGLPVTVSSSTLEICTLSDSTVRGVAAGICTLAANQAGNSSFSPAAPATLSFSIAAAPLPPGPPTNISITPGRGSATLIFSAPSGSAIARYTARCAASGQTTRTATGTASPLTVRNLSGGALYQCTLTATDGSGLTSVASAPQPVTPAAGKNSLTPILLLLLD
jgi:hypothetical protein